MFWRFIQNDIWATIIPGIIVTITAIVNSPIGYPESIILLFKSALFFLLYVYAFTLTNQYKSIGEDIINKPFRPLPSKMISVKEMPKRIIILTSLFLIYSYYLNVLIWAFLWVATYSFLYSIGHKHWFTKNIIAMSLGIFSMIGAGWYLVSPMDNDQIIWAITISFVNGLCGVIQDFRDKDGDMQIGRKTLSIVYSETKSRIIASIFCIISLFIVLTTIILPSNFNIYTSAFSTIIIFLYILIPIRLLTLKNHLSDDKTYKYLLYLFNILIISGVVFL